MCTILFIHRSPRCRWLSALVSNERPRGHNSNRILIICVLYFTVFTGVEFVPPGTSNLGVTIQIVFSYAMQHRGKESNEISFPKVQENTLRSDAVLCLPFEQSKPFALFPTMCVDMHLRRFPAYVEEMQSGSQEDASRPDAHPKSKGNILKINYLQSQSN